MNRPIKLLKWLLNLFDRLRPGLQIFVIPESIRNICRPVRGLALQKKMPDHRKIAFDRIKIIPDHWKTTFDHIKIVPDHLKIIFARVKIIPDHQEIIFARSGRFYETQYVLNLMYNLTF